MKHPKFHVGEVAVIGYAPDFPHWVGEECVIIGGLMSRPNYDKFGNLRGKTDAYRIRIEGQEACAPERCLRKRFERSDWGMLRGIWQPKREAR